MSMMDRLEIKATLEVTDTGEIIGLAWPFGEADSVGDIITKGAFGPIAADLPMLFSHDPADLIGSWNETIESDNGLVTKGQLHMDQPRARAVLSMVKSGLITGLSIGFRTKASTKQGRNRVISALELAEISVVRNPAHPKARITAAKSNDTAITVAAAIERFTAALRTNQR
jgi:HK97 family phage prohead protease